MEFQIRVVHESSLFLGMNCGPEIGVASTKAFTTQITVLTMIALKLAKEKPQEAKPLDALGDILRSHKRFDEAAVYYGRAIDLIDTPKKKDYSLYYARGVCFERMDQWAKAEADLQMAMELDPEQPLVLNYLGSSWVDQGRNLKEAMGLIRKAVKLDPNDGYFVDSLGWAHYRLGNYPKAVEHLERAVELRPWSTHESPR